MTRKHQSRCAWAFQRAWALYTVPLRSEISNAAACQLISARSSEVDLWRHACRLGGAAFFVATWLYTSCTARAAYSEDPTRKSVRTCKITTIDNFKSCFSKPDVFDRFVFDADLTCGSGEECCIDGNGAIMRFVDMRDKTIDGQNHTLLRLGGQRACSAIDATRSRSVVIKDLNLNEDQDSPPCELSEAKCPPTVKIEASQDVELESTHIYFGKGYAVRIWDTDGFTFHRSVISDAGIIGLYVGHFKFGPSTRVAILDSVVAHSRTNGIALQGVNSGDASEPILVQGTVLTGNHWHGLWSVPGVSGGITSGGQLLVADGRNIRLIDDIVAEGVCENCKPVGQTVTAIEIADQAPPPAGVAGLTVEHDTFLGSGGPAVYQNAGTEVSEVIISENRLIGFSRLDDLIANATRARNKIAPLTSGDAIGAYRAILIVRAGMRHVERDTSKANLADAIVEGTFELSPYPRPGGAFTPLYRCSEDGGASVDYVSTSRTCDGRGKINAVLGYSYEPSYPNAKPFFACRLAEPGSEFFLSWDHSCEGRRLVSSLGFALNGLHSR